jgi:signal transduction histidine kinase
MTPKITTINTDNGLSNQQVHAIAQDATGRLYLAAPTGLSRYNGSQIKVFDHSDGLECIGLRTVRVGMNGTIWIGTDQGLESLDNDGTKKIWKIYPDWEYGICECIFIKENLLWLGTSYGLLHVQINESENIIELLWKQEVGLVRSIVEKDEHTLFVLSANFGLLEFTGDQFDQNKHQQLLAIENIQCISTGKNNTILIGTREGLYLLDHDDHILGNFKPGVSNNRVTAITKQNNHFWIGIGHMLIYTQIRENQLQVLEMIEIGSVINELFIDIEENIWIATNNSGLKKISCLEKAFHQLNTGSPGAAFCIKKNQGTGKFYVGGDGFFSIFSEQNDLAHNLKLEKSYKFPGIIWDICIPPADSSMVWLATSEGLFISIEGREPERMLNHQKNIAAPNRVLLCRNNEIWLGTIAGLFRIQNDTVEELLNKNGNRFGYIYNLSLDENNKLWISTLGMGLWRETENGIIPFENALLSEQGNTYTVCANKHEETLIIQEDRVLLADKNLQVHLLLKENPVAGWTAIWLNNNTIAIGSNNGVILFDTETSKIIQRINPVLGKSAWQFTSSRSLYSDNQNRLFCAINAGLFIIELEKFERFRNPPKIFFEKTIWQNTVPEFENGIYKIKSGKWSVNFHVYTNWFIDEEQIRFRFKLVGFDENWSDLQQIPIIRYNSLPIGKYYLQCQVYTPLTGFGTTENLINLEITNSFVNKLVRPFNSVFTNFQTRFFKEPARNKILLQRNTELETEINERIITEKALIKSREDIRMLASLQEKIKEEERLRISREVHDELGQMLTAIKMGIALLRKKSNTDEKIIPGKLDEIMGLVDDTTSTVRRIATELRPGLLDSFGLTAALEWQAKELEKRSGIQISFTTNCKDRLLDKEVSIVYFRIFQETLNNISKYAETKSVESSLFLENNYLTLYIRDFGIGFNLEQMATKNTLGILGMKERALMIGGNYTIKSEPGEGTQTSVWLKYTEPV